MSIHKLKINNKNISIENIQDLHYNNMVYRVNIHIRTYLKDYYYIIKDYKTLSGLFKYLRKYFDVKNKKAS